MPGTHKQQPNRTQTFYKLHPAVLSPGGQKTDSRVGNQVRNRKGPRTPLSCFRRGLGFADELAVGLPQSDSARSSLASRRSHTSSMTSARKPANHGRSTHGEQTQLTASNPQRRFFPLEFSKAWGRPRRVPHRERQTARWRPNPCCRGGQLERDGALRYPLTVCQNQQTTTHQEPVVCRHRQLARRVGGGLRG